MHVTHCRVYTSFALEAILATAFGRRVDLQKGESDEVTKAMSMMTQSVSDGQFEQFLVMSSKLYRTGALSWMLYLVSFSLNQILFHGRLRS